MRIQRCKPSQDLYSYWKTAMAYAIKNTIDPQWQVVLNWSETDKCITPSWQINVSSLVSKNLQKYSVPERFFLSRLQNVGAPRELFRENVPMHATFETPRKRLTDFALVQTWMAISQRVRDHIEILEQGRNQYFSFEVKRKNGKSTLGPDGEPLNGSYYLLNATCRFDAVNVEKSIIEPIKGGLVWEQVGKLDKIVLNKNMVAGHHVWEGINHLRGTLMISNELGDWIIANKMKGMILTKLLEE